MMIIQVIVIIAALGILVFMLGGRQTYATRAWKKITFCLLAVAMVIAVIFPDTTNKAAHIVGVGRGADLLLYTLAIVFIGYVLSNYIRQQRDKDIVYRLARKVALLDANERYKSDIKFTRPSK
jgi:hypothetical protein